ncbi:MAG: hypothetical protein AB1921_08935 [Thermodesulfobacteriota bacterium]
MGERTEKKQTGNILMLKTGYNPNSSSIGTNLAPFLAIGTILAFAVPMASFLISQHIRRKKDQLSPAGKES